MPEAASSRWVYIAQKPQVHHMHRSCNIWPAGAAAGGLAVWLVIQDLIRNPWGLNLRLWFAGMDCGSGPQ